MKALLRSTLLRKVLLAGCLLLPSLVWGYLGGGISKKPLGVIFLDVGQGDSIYIQTKEGVRVLEDGGPGADVVGQLDKYVPYYDRSLDLLISSHPDADHLAGLVEVLTRYQVNRVIANEYPQTTEVQLDWAASLVASGLEPLPAFRGDRFSFGELTFEVLWPPSKAFLQEIRHTNLGSVVVLVRYGGFSVLLTGDIDTSIESQLDLEQKVTVLKVPHHGAATSLCEDFLKQISPQLSVLSVGPNAYGHPTDQALSLAEQYSLKVLRTDLFGNVAIFSDGSSWDLNWEKMK